MRMSKVVVCILCILFLFTACLETKNNQSSVISSETQSQPGSSSTDFGTISEDSTISKDETEYSVNGTVKDATMNFLVLTGEDGEEYSFYTGEADKSGLKNGLLIDMKITVFNKQMSDYPGSLTAIRLVD